MNRALDLAQKALRYPVSLMLGQLPVTIAKAVLTVRREDGWDVNNMATTDPVVNTRDYVNDLKWHWKQNDTPADKYFHRGAVIACLAIRLAAGIGTGKLWHDIYTQPENSHSFVAPSGRDNGPKTTVLFQDAPIATRQLPIVRCASIAAEIPSLRTSAPAAVRASEELIY